MSSHELLGLISEFPEHSKFREARDRTHTLPDGSTVVDWPKDRKIQAFLARELALARFSAGLTSDENPPDLSELLSPLELALVSRQKVERDSQIEGNRSRMLSQLYANVAER